MHVDAASLKGKPFLEYFMCLFVRMKMKNGLWEGQGCEGAKLSLAIHSFWPPV